MLPLPMPIVPVAGDTALHLKLVPFGTIWALCNISGQYPPPAILTTYHSQVFTAFHTMGHPGAKATRRLMKEHVVWPCMMLRAGHIAL